MTHTILITGANGFVGSHTLETLMKIKHADLDIIVACRDRRKLPPEYKGEVRTGDLRDPDYLDHVLAGVDIICHAAGWPCLWGHKKESRKLYLEPTLHLIDKAIEWKVKRFVNPGSIYAATAKDTNAHNPGIKRSYWPHLNHMIEIENYMREHCHLGCSMVNLRMGIFAGKRYGMGLLPVATNKLAKHVLPNILCSKAGFPVVDGIDVGQAFSRAALAPQQLPYESFNIVGPEVPEAKTVLEYLHSEFDYPKPWYGLPWQLAHIIATIDEKLELLIRKEPMFTRSMVHMFRGSDANNERASEMIGYQPEIHWKQSIQHLVEEITRSPEYKTRLTRSTRKLDL